jgi:two-component system chemotaxis sensor kinase CheA
LAITDVMLVGVGEERYLIPTSHIVKSFKPVEGELSTLLERGEMVTIRGELLPLYRLHRIFNVDRAEENPMEALLVVITSGDSRYALLVDGLLGQQQVVAKSLGNGIGKVTGVSGAAILGDGKVGLILDVLEIARLARQGPVRYRETASSSEQPSFIN